MLNKEQSAGTIAGQSTNADVNTVSPAIGNTTVVCSLFANCEQSQSQENGYFTDLPGGHKLGFVNEESYKEYMQTCTRFLKSNSIGSAFS